jgi:hypothetical protein
MASETVEAGPGATATAGADAEALASVSGRPDGPRPPHSRDAGDFVSPSREGRARGSLPSSSRSKAFVGGCFALCALCSLACSGGSSSAQGTDAGSVGAAAAAPATFTEIYVTILQPSCSVCHKPGGIGAFQDFSSQSSAYTALVGVKASGPSCGSSGETRVVAGNASQSLLFQKVSEANPPCGSQMPLGGPPLSSVQMTSIEEWINAGALND